MRPQHRAGAFRHSPIRARRWLLAAEQRPGDGPRPPVSGSRRHQPDVPEGSGRRQAVLGRDVEGSSRVQLAATPSPPSRASGSSNTMEQLMAKAQHRTPEYRAERKRIDEAQAAGLELWCNEVLCLMDSRVILPNQPADVCHDVTGTVIRGPGHSRCNRSEGATRGNKARADVGPPLRMRV